MVDDRQIEYFNVFQRFGHQFRGFNRIAVIAESDRPGFHQRLEIDQRPAFAVFGDTADGQNLYQAVPSGFGFYLHDQIGAVQRRTRVRHAANRGESADGSSVRPGDDRFLVFKARLAQVAMKIDQSRADDQSFGRQGVIGFAGGVFPTFADPGDFIVFCE